MISKLPHQPTTSDKHTMFRQLEAEAQQNCTQTQRKLKIARTMKAMQYDFMAIFEATGLQPEIIQSL